MKHIFIQLFLCFSPLLLQAQPKPDLGRKRASGIDVRRINYQDKNNLYKDEIGYNKKYRYVLENINRLVFEETATEQKGENYNTDKPEIMKLTLPGFYSPAGGSSGNAILMNGGNPPSGPEKLKTKKPVDRCKCEPSDSLIFRDEALRLAYLRLKIIDSSIQKLAGKFLDFKKINKQLENLKASTNLIWDTVLKKKQAIIFVNLAIDVPERDSKDTISATFRHLSDSIKNYIKNEVNPLSEIVNASLDLEIKIKKECLTDLYRNLRCGDSCKNKREYIQLENSMATLRECIENLESASSKMKQYLKDGESLIEKFDSIIDDGKIEEIQRNYNLLVHENFELKIEEFIADKDVHEITFTTNAEGPLLFGEPTKRTIKVKAVTKGGFKIDYSTGAFYNWGDDEFLGPEYYLESPTDSTKVIRVADRTKKAMFSVGALMHVSWRFHSFVRPAVSFGVSTTAGFDVLNFHAGMSLILGKPGKPKRIVVSIGFTLKESELLNSRYSLGAERKDYPDEVPTTKNFPLKGFFMSLTYNLAGISK